MEPAHTTGGLAASPPVRLAARTAVVAEQPEVAGVVGPLFDTVGEILSAAGASLETPIAQYEMGEDGMRIVAGYAVGQAVPDGVVAVDLPAVPTAICRPAIMRRPAGKAPRNEMPSDFRSYR